MKRCPLTYEQFEGVSDYSPEGLKQLARNLKNLKRFPLSAKEQRTESLARSGKMSIQGMQLKLSAVLNIKGEQFDIVDSKGRYILKPPHADYEELPENEDLTMDLAQIVGFDVPAHGLLLAKDDTRTYFIKRFDRIPQRVSVEDLAQLSGATRDTKYNSSMEQIAGIIDRYCTFPALEKTKLFELTFFSFLVGNEDMHLKNFSLISRGLKVTLSPVYDLLNTSIVLKTVKEELALPIRGKKAKIKREDLIDYFAISHLKIQEKVVDRILKKFEDVLPRWQEHIQKSFLSRTMKMKYEELLLSRSKRVGVLKSHGVLGCCEQLGKSDSSVPGPVEDPEFWEENE